MLHICLIVVVPVILRDIPIVNHILEKGILLYNLHPILGVLFYSPGLVCSIVAVITIVTLKDKYYPNHPTISKVLFYLLLSVGIMTRLIINPAFFTNPRLILQTIILFFIIRLYYHWKNPNKTYILFAFVGIIMFFTSRYILNRYVYYTTGRTLKDLIMIVEYKNIMEAAKTTQSNLLFLIINIEKWV